MPTEKFKTIVVAEDDLAMREIITRKLSSQGFIVKGAEDGIKALELIKSEKPSLVLLDLMMPEMDGFGVLEALRHNSNQDIAKTPVIVLSNLWSNEDILKVKAYSVAAYLVKAYFTPEEILAKINEVLGNSNN